MTILILGDYYGDEEAETGEAFSGKSGWLLRQLLSQVGVDLKDCHRLAVINRRVNGDYALCGPRAEGLTPAFATGKYIRAEYSTDIEDTKARIKKIAPNVIIAAGSLASWMLLGTAKIKAVRGAMTMSNIGIKTLVTHNPKEVFRDWTLRPIVLNDRERARRESASPILTRPAREIWIEPTLADLDTFNREHMQHAEQVSIDIETASDQITCIGFAPSPAIAIVIPFACSTVYRPNGNYWQTIEEELAAWQFVKHWCENANALFQNGMYDVQFLWRRYGIRVPGMNEDTMLLHHAMQPEMSKGLGFLGSLYSDEASWKFMRKAKHD